MIEIKVKLVINMSGFWVDKVWNLNFMCLVFFKMCLIKGIYLVVDVKKLFVL